jgi:hypothetical protein
MPVTTPDIWNLDSLVLTDAFLTSTRTVISATGAIQAAYSKTFYASIPEATVRTFSERSLKDSKALVRARPQGYGILVYSYYKTCYTKLTIIKISEMPIQVSMGKRLKRSLMRNERGHKDHGFRRVHHHPSHLPNFRYSSNVHFRLGFASPSPFSFSFPLSDFIEDTLDVLFRG